MSALRIQPVRPPKHCEGRWQQVFIYQNKFLIHLQRLPLKSSNYNNYKTVSWQQMPKKKTPGLYRYSKKYTKFIWKVGSFFQSKKAQLATFFQVTQRSSFSTSDAQVQRQVPAPTQLLPPAERHKPSLEKTSKVGPKKSTNIEPCGFYSKNISKLMAWFFDVKPSTWRHFLELFFYTLIFFRSLEFWQIFLSP